jgi:hypothetical protein
MIASGTVTVPSDQDVVTTSKVNCKLRAVPIGIMRWIELDIGFTTSS